ncbi:hypothetical protein SAMN05421748_13395 [Paractinoplanes atraurantiacus]|uniref:Uncharacterized protein n=1 Tax=Paractinoplanes atraurantiacus TaxID=1036182 RepID=A0A285K9J3_9ACTN|nr:hypothetical protein SAMN05421748_13395 [Actinoplanes atraurantiacus]
MEKKKTWTKPRTECLESRAEISGYAGVDRPWLTKR